MIVLKLVVKSKKKNLEIEFLTSEKLCFFILLYMLDWKSLFTLLPYYSCFCYYWEEKMDSKKSDLPVWSHLKFYHSSIITNKLLLLDRAKGNLICLIATSDCDLASDFFLCILLLYDCQINLLLVATNAATQNSHICYSSFSSCSAWIWLQDRIPLKWTSVQSAHFQTDI